MKIIKPGQIYHPPNLACNVRAKKRICGCSGCVLNNEFVCPDIQTKNNTSHERPYCEAQGIIFVKP